MPLAPIMNMVEFKLRREAAGMTQEACASWLGMSRESVARIETGATALTLRTGMQAAVLFGYLAFAPVRDEPATPAPQPRAKPVVPRPGAPASGPLPAQAGPVDPMDDNTWSTEQYVHYMRTGERPS